MLKIGNGGETEDKRDEDDADFLDSDADSDENNDS